MCAFIESQLERVRSAGYDVVNCLVAGDAAVAMTEHALNARRFDCVMFGAAESIDGIVRRILAEWPNPEIPMVIGTGGLAELFAPLATILPDLDGTRFALAGLSLTAGHSYLHVVASGLPKLAERFCAKAMTPSTKSPLAAISCWMSASSSSCSSMRV